MTEPQTADAGFDPAADFAAAWPDVLRYSHFMSGRLAWSYRLDRDDLFAAGTLAVWRACLRGTLARDADRVPLALVVARRGMLVLARADLRHARRQRTNVGAAPGADDGEDALDALAVAPPEPDRDGLPELLALAGPAHRGLLGRYYRDGETQAAIGADLGVHEQTVHNRVNLALRVMRARLMPENDPGGRPTAEGG